MTNPIVSVAKQLEAEQTLLKYAAFEIQTIYAIHHWTAIHQQCRFTTGLRPGDWRQSPHGESGVRCRW